MEHLSLTPATQAVLKALAELGQGNVHELADKSGKARSTTDKAIKTLADAGLIVAVDTGADPAEDTPTRWNLSEDAAAAMDATDLTDETAAGTDEPDPGDIGDVEQYGEETGDDVAATDGDDAQQVSDEDDQGPEDADDTKQGENPSAVMQATRPGDRKVMAIKGVLADHSDGATVEVIVAESGISHPTTIRLLAAMEQADAARRLPGLPQRWIAGPTKASEVDPNPEPPRCALCFQVIRGVTSTPAAVAAVQSLIRPDGTLHIVGSDDQVHVVALPTRLPPRSLNTSPSTVGHRSDVTVNGDGSQPFGRGELERLTIAVLADNPGRPMTPQDIATVISAQLGGRTVSSGAVRNNCTKAAAAGSVLLVSDAPLTFVFPAPPADDSSTETNGEQPAANDGAADGGDPTGQPGREYNRNGSEQP
ncbi:MAG TPA: MarR family winged helix-turn-helix transcriptional regulator [Actinoplanes sp.]